MPLFDFRCQSCQHVFEAFSKYDDRPSCPLCQSGTEKIWIGRSTAIVPDGVPGGFVIENLDTEPRTFYSKSEYRNELKARGLRIRDRHVGLQGSDRSPHTSRWV